jgi:hypothetical protein
MSSPTIRDGIKSPENQNKNVVSANGELSFTLIPGYGNDNGAHSHAAEAAKGSSDAKQQEKPVPAVEVSPISPYYHKDKHAAAEKAPAEKPAANPAPQDKVPAVAVSPLYGLRGSRLEPGEKMPNNLGIIG